MSCIRDSIPAPLLSPALISALPRRYSLMQTSAAFSWCKEGDDLVRSAVVENVKNVVGYILNNSRLITDAAHTGMVRIAGAYYSISSGIVEEIALE